MVHVYGIRRVIYCSSFPFNRLSLTCLDQYSGKDHLAWHEFQAIKIDLYKRIWKGGPRVVWGCVKVDICEVFFGKRYMWGWNITLSLQLEVGSNWEEEREREQVCVLKRLPLPSNVTSISRERKKKWHPWLLIRWASCNYGCTRCATSADGSRHWLGWPLSMMMTEMNGPQRTSIYYKDDVSWESL